jgi:hypothetical protein
MKLPCLGYGIPPGCAYSIAIGAKEADDEASRSTAGGWPRLAHRST